jgi:hypothetical protein
MHFVTERDRLPVGIVRKEGAFLFPACLFLPPLLACTCAILYAQQAEYGDAS